MSALNPNSRITAIDALRGFALAGVALVHVTEQYLAGPSPEGFMEGLNGPVDHFLMGFIGLFIQGKFFALFSILFGLSFFIQMDSADRKGEDFSWRFLWRAVLLFLIGYMHQLFYRGDILTIYALLVPFLIPFHRVSNKWVLGMAAIFFLSLPRLISFATLGTDNLFGLPNGFQNPMETAYYETLQSGTLLEVFEKNAIFGMKTKMSFQLLFFGRFYYTFGYFLLGLWIGKIGLFQNTSTFLPYFKKIMLGFTGFLVLSFILTAITFMTAPQPMDFTHFQHILGINFSDWINLSLALLILCAFILLYQEQNWQKRLNFFAPYGRMALTNYILQSIIGTYLFFGWGLGLIGQLRSAYLVLIALVLIVVQAYFSKYWLQNFKYGPLEWLWRSATYLKWQAFRR